MTDTTDELALRIKDLYRKLASSSLSSDEMVDLPEGFEDAGPEAIDDLVAKKTVTEEDILPIARFKADMGTILDVGAHWGYTAVSMRNAGTTCPILSFEALAAHRRCLARFKEIDPNYDFHIGPVSDKPGEVVMYNIVANGTPITGINSIGGATLTEAHAQITADAARAYCGSTAHIDVKIGVYRAKTRVLDDLLDATKFRMQTQKIAVMKIDVEGHEAYVVRGGIRRIATSKPLLIVEYGGVNNPILDVIGKLGYKMARRDGDRIEPYDGAIAYMNQYFYHADKLPEYKKIGLM